MKPYEPSLCISLYEKHCGRDKKKFDVCKHIHALAVKSTQRMSCQIFADILGN